MKPVVALLTSVVLVAGCGGGSGEVSDQGTVTATGAADDQRATVGMNDKLQFAPNVVRAKVGTLTLTADNLGRVPHNLGFDADGLGKSGTIAGGAAEAVRTVFTKSGTFTFTCTFHSGMAGRVIVS